MRKPTRRQMDLLRLLAAREDCRSHGLVRTGRLVGPHGSGAYGTRLIRRAERAGWVHVTPCSHGVPQALDVVISTRGLFHAEG